MNKLRDDIRARYGVLGDTEAGANWCELALHPAAGPLEVRGIPDADAFPSVCMDYESVVSITAPSGSGATWFSVLNLLGHPVQPVAIASLRSLGSYQYDGVYNPTLISNTAYSEMTVAFSKLCNAYRMLYCGITVDLDASALVDSGSVVAGQFPLEYQELNYARPMEGACISNAHIITANFATNFPGQSIAQLPGAYMGLAKDGVYLPLKISPCAPWVTTMHGTMAAVACPTTAVAPSYDSLRQLILPNATPSGGNVFPFYGRAVGGLPAPFVGAWAFSDQTINGDVAIPLQQTNMGHIVFYNLNPAAALTLKVRWGVEMRIEPTSLLAPALRPSAKHDTLALMAYSDLAGSLPWAYPSAYNANGKVLDMIKKAWNVLRPTLATGMGFIPHPAAQGAAALLRSLPDFERPAGTGTTVAKGGTPSANIPVATRRVKRRPKVPPKRP